MRNWTEVAGRTLTNLGAVVLGIVAAKELSDTGSDIVEALQSSNEDTHLLA
jgi:hypothetical protein